MSARRRAPNSKEKIASCLLRIKEEDGSALIPEPLRSTGTADEICASIQFDHTVLHSIGGDTRPQNITPMRIADHRVKTLGPSKATSAGGDIHAAAHSKRIQRKQAEFKARLLAKDAGEKPPRHKAKAKMRGGRDDKLKSGFGKVINRETGEVVWERTR